MLSLPLLLQFFSSFISSLLLSSSFSSSSGHLTFMLLLYTLIISFYMYISLFFSTLLFYCLILPCSPFILTSLLHFPTQHNITPLLSFSPLPLSSPFVCFFSGSLFLFLLSLSCLLSFLNALGLLSRVQRSRRWRRVGLWTRAWVVLGVWVRAQCSRPCSPCPRRGKHCSTAAATR